MPRYPSEWSIDDDVILLPEKEWKRKGRIIYLPLELLQKRERDKKVPEDKLKISLFWEEKARKRGEKHDKNLLKWFN